MTAKARWIYACFVAVIVSGCAPQPVLRPVTDPTARFTGIGYSVLPPQGKDWYIERHSQYITSFGKLFPEKMERYHTFVATVMVMKPEAKKVNSSAEFPKAIEQFIVGFATTGRFRLISVNVGPYGPSGSYCSRYDMVQEEKNNPRAPGVILEITAHGFWCLDASSEFMVHAFYSERKAQGSQSYLDDALKQEGEGFLKNVVFTPLY